MSITVTCTCGKKLKAPDSLAGQQARCPTCRNLVTVPATPAPMQDDQPIVLTPEESGGPPMRAPGAVPSMNAKLSASAPGPAAASNPAPVNKPAGVRKSPPAPTEPGKPLSDEPSKSIEPSEEKDSYELATDLFEAPSAVTAAAKAGGDGDASRPRACESCGAAMKPGDKICGVCGFDPRKGSSYEQISKKALRSSRYANQDQTKSFGNFMGVEMTARNLVLVLILVLILGGAITWWFTGPGANIHFNNMQVVNATSPLLPIEDLAKASRNPIMAQGLPGGGALGQFTQSSQKGFGIGGGEELLVMMQPDKDGQHVLIDIDISQRLIQEEKLEDRYLLYFNEDSFTIDGPGGPVKGVMLLEEQKSGLQLATAGSNASAPQALWPTGHKPTYYEFESGRGLASWDGTSGLKGKIEFISFAYNSSTGAKGLSANGSLQLLGRNTQIDLQYQGSFLTVIWNSTNTGYVGSVNHRKTPDINPYVKHPFKLLFPRIPVGQAGASPTSEYQLKVGNRAVRKLDANLVVYNPRPAGSQAIKPLTSGDPITQYLSTLAAVRQKATGIVSHSNLNQLAMGIGMYAQNSGGKMPDSIKDLANALGSDFEGLMFNPRTKEKPGFLYVKPADAFSQIKDPANTVIIYELFEGKPDPNGQVVFADGRIGPHPQK